LEKRKFFAKIVKNGQKSDANAKSDAKSDAPSSPVTMRVCGIFEKFVRHFCFKSDAGSSPVFMRVSAIFASFFYILLN